MSEIKLLPCPFCGGRVGIAIFGYDGEEWYSTTKIGVENQCTCRMFMESEKFYADDEESVKEKHKQDLIKAWNTRKLMERILKRLRQKEVLDSVAHIEGSQEEILTNGYVKGIKKAIEIVKEEGGIE